ncbi:MAG: formimidoylglutamase [Chitinophagaceae bacterium]|nr:formimidoylglutamase [Chitinophagaceae bacterium]
MNHFKTFSKNKILSLTRVRKFETKLGERVEVLSEKTDIHEAIRNCKAKYILFGIPEDIGIIANYGIGGSDSVWPAFLSSFLNIQSNDFLSGEEIAVIGYFDFHDLKNVIEENAYNYEEKTDAYRHAVNTIDEEVEELAKIITTAGKIPVAIGGGHNNSYPLIKGSAKGLFKSEKIPLAQINCINLDAHTDFRPSEGRHSGNGFRYAEEDGYLEKYCVIGIHENYLPQNVWLDIVNDPFLDIITYEDIFIHEKRNFMQAMAHAAAFTEDNFTGIELDIDSIQNTLSSAETPAGIFPLQARQYMNFMGIHTKAAYLHICEGASQLSDGRKSGTTGKLISYLVSDFIKGSIQ